MKKLITILILVVMSFLITFFVIKANYNVEQCFENDKLISLIYRFGEIMQIISLIIGCIFIIILKYNTKSFKICLFITVLFTCVIPAIIYFSASRMDRGNEISCWQPMCIIVNKETT